jgi:hypothetical protein
LSAKVIKDEFAVLPERPRDLFHRFDPGAHGLQAPLVEELARPRGRVVVPESLEGFLKEIGADRLQVIAE